MAVEVVRTLTGSIGLVASVPLTTALAAFVIDRRSSRPAPTTTGTFDGLTHPMRGRDVELPSLRVERMERVHAPTDPYEFP